MLIAPDMAHRHSPRLPGSHGLSNLAADTDFAHGVLRTIYGQDNLIIGKYIAWAEYDGDNRHYN
jgi:hypothetical protein